MIALFVGTHSKKHNNPFTARASVYNLLLAKAKMVVLSPALIRENKMLCYKRGIWVTRSLGDIKVVYDRTINRTQERNSLPFLNRLRENAIIFNGGFFSKDKIHQMIKHMPYCPVSTTNIEEAQSIIQRFGSVYAKPVTGSFGKGIVNVSTIDKLPRGNYIYQQPIDLLRDNGNIIDFRVHMAKDKYFNWNIVACACKRAGNGRITTHFKYGGSRIYNISDSVIDIVVSVSLDIALELEQNMPHLAELGLDIGVDNKLNAWIFEANSKPGFSALTQAEREHWAECIAGYCKEVLHNVKQD